MAPAEQRPYKLEDEEVTTKMTPAVQRATDRLVRGAFLWAFPHWTKPNHLTFLRLVLIPVVLVLLGLHFRWPAFAVFIVAICTDFVDGTMARTRNQITVLGTYLDPVADKLLIGAVLAWTGYRYLIVDIILAFIVLELVLSAIGVRMLVRTRTLRSSNAFGKSKMVMQSLALFLFLLGKILELETVVTISLWLLWLALALAFVSGLIQIQGMLKKHPPVEPPPA
jgi:CDP-diacylglycerol--glycerol-3-phosphate 3-phosphatidyltransferase